MFVSAKTGKGIDTLLERLTELVHGGKSRVTFVIPNAKQGALNTLYAAGAAIESVDYGAENVTVVAVVDERTRGALRAYDSCPPSKKEDWED